MTTQQTLIVLAAFSCFAAALAMLILSKLDLYRIRRRFKSVVDVEAETARLAREGKRLAAQVSAQRTKWDREYTETVVELEGLKKQLDAARDSVEMQSFGLYQPYFSFGASQQYKERLDSVRKDQKDLVRAGRAAVCVIEWTVEGSAAKGKQMTKRYLKMQLRAFNGECDAAVAKVKYNNVVALIERLQRAFDALNKLGETQRCEITKGYLDLKLAELRLAHEYAQKRQAEKEEQREIREQIREEEKVLQEAERATREAEQEERRFDQALVQARRELAAATALEEAELRRRVLELERNLEESRAKKERAISRAQMTRSGHVYVISNIGSFGEQVYKIGLTRRLEPLDRVRELGDASVPFRFDVHAMMFSEDAPSLEKELHRRFESRRVNLVNGRKEFFQVSMSEIETAVRDLGQHVEVTKAAEAEEYRRSLGIRTQQGSQRREGSPTVVSHAKDLLERRKAVWQGQPQGSA